MGRPGARKGDMTSHGNPTAPGPGSLTVNIGGFPAWRAFDDTHMCPIPIAPPAPAPHAAEICYLGSFGVLINGKMAVRQGDFLVGAGPPNSFALGCATVLIGDIAFGLADPANITEFCADFNQLMQDWNSLTPDQREQELERIINRQLSKSGVPTVGVNSANLGQNVNGELNFQSWNLDINRNLLSPNNLSASQAGDLANTLYHEARHAEQWYAMARTQAASGGVTTQLATDMGSRSAMVRAATSNPLSGNSPQAVFGQAMNESVYGSRRSFRGDLFNNHPLDYDNYRALPEEQDAWNTGDATCGCP